LKNKNKKQDKIALSMERTGSVKKGIVAPDLLEERAKCAFDQ